MTNKERDRVMDQFFERNRHHVPLVSPQEMGAIKDADKKARAWDRVMSHGTIEDPASCSPRHWRDVHEYMESILNPTPKDPLERLEEWVLNPSNELISKRELLAEIDRLKGEK